MEEDIINVYFELGLEYQDIVHCLRENHGITVSLRHLKRLLRDRGMCRRKDYSNLNEVVLFIEEQLQRCGQLHGYRWMYTKCIENNLRVRKEDVRLILMQMDPNGVDFRRARRLHRRAYFAKGPNFIWHLDSYDKLKPFGFGINGCIDGFSRKLLWLNVYHTNNDPRVIGGYYMTCIESLRACPQLVRGDLGTENVKVKDFQNVLLNERGYISGPSTANQRIESFWGQLRKECVEFWICLFHEMVNDGIMSGDFIDRNLALFCFTALIQDDLDEVQRVWNSHIIRPSSNTQVPSGRPNVMYNVPALYDAEDYSIPVRDDLIQQCTQQCVMRKVIPCDENMYDLCLIIMQEKNLNWPSDAEEAFQLFVVLKDEIQTMTQG